MIILIMAFYAMFFTGNIPEFRSTLNETMYVGMENLVPISLNGCDINDIEIKMSSGTLYQKDDSTFAFQSPLPFDEFKIKLYYKKMICQIKTVSLKALPELIPYFEGENRGFIKKADLDKLGKLVFNFPEDYPVEMRGQISYFNVFIINTSGIAVYSSTIRSAQLDQSAMQTLKSLDVGSRISINNIVCVSPSGGQVRVNASREIVVI